MQKGSLRDGRDCKARCAKHIEPGPADSMGAGLQNGGIAWGMRVKPVDLFSFTKGTLFCCDATSRETWPMGVSNPEWASASAALLARGVAFPLLFVPRPMCAVCSPPFLSL